MLHEQWQRPAESWMGEEERTREEDDQEPLVSEEQRSHHRHLHPTKDLFSQLRDKDMEDESDEKEKLRDQEKSGNYVAGKVFEQSSVLWRCLVANPGNCCQLPIPVHTLLHKIVFSD